MDKEDRDNFRTIANQSAGQQQGYKSRGSHGGLDPDSCLTMARQICGSYRRDEAQDPETFAAAVAVVLGDYPADIARIAADPRTGVAAAFPNGLPQVGQIKEFLDGLHKRKLYLEHLASLPKPDFNDPPRPKAGPGDWANVLVHSDAPQYPHMVERARQPGADPREFRFVRQGIWVGARWFEAPRQQLVSKTFKLLSDDDLRALYPKAPAEGQEDAA